MDNESFNANEQKNEFIQPFQNQKQLEAQSQAQTIFPQQFQKLYAFMKFFKQNPTLMHSLMNQNSTEMCQDPLNIKKHRKREYPLEKYKQSLCKNQQTLEKQKQDQKCGQERLQGEDREKIESYENLTVEECHKAKEQSQNRQNYFDQISIKQNSFEGKNQMDQKIPLSKENQFKNSLIVFDDERPIQGISGSFREHIKNLPEIVNIPSDENDEKINQSKQDKEETGRKKPFLKKGSGRVLSNSKNKSSPLMRKKCNTYCYVSDQSKDKIDFKSSRETSKNRFLSHRKVNERSMNKKEGKNQKFVLNTNQQRQENKEPCQTPTFKKTQLHSPQIFKERTAKTNVFLDESSSQNQFQKVKQPKHVQKKQVISGIFLTKQELEQILKKYQNVEDSLQRQDEERIEELKKKYVYLCNLAVQQKMFFEKQMKKQKNILLKERQEFEEYKNSELTKIINKKNAKQMSNRKTINSQKEQLYIVRRQVEKQKEQYKKKDKNNKMRLEKYKRELQDLKYKYNLLLKEKRQENNCSVCNSRKEENFQSKISRNQQAQTEKGIRQNKKKVIKIKDETSLQKQRFSYRQDLNPKKNQMFQKQEYKSEERYEQIIEYTPQMMLSDLTKIPLNIKMVTDEMIMNMFRYQKNPEYRNYLSIKRGYREKISVTKNHKENYTTNIYKDGGRQFIFENGVKKEYFPNKYSITFFTNGDIKQELKDGSIFYYYKEREVDHITLKNNVNIYRFKNNQVEFHFEDRIQIRYPDCSYKEL